MLMKRLCCALAGAGDLVLLALALPGALILGWIVARDERRDAAAKAADAGVSPDEYERRMRETGL